MSHTFSNTLCHLTIVCICLTSILASSRTQAGEELLLDGLFKPELGTEGEIETDRDSFTPATTLTPEGRVIFESAWSFIDNLDTKDTHSLPEILVRYGTTDWLELRIGTNYEIGGEPSDVSSSSGTLNEVFEEASDGLEEEANISYGFKLDLTDQQSWIPDSAIILTGSTPTSGEETDTQVVGTYVFGWRLENEWEWDTAIRYGRRGEGKEAIDLWAPSTVIKFPISERSKGHIEYFSIFGESEERATVKHFISPGIHYLVTEEFEIGIRVGWGLNNESANFFSNVGIGILY